MFFFTASFYLSLVQRLFSGLVHQKIYRLSPKAFLLSSFLLLTMEGDVIVIFSANDVSMVASMSQALTYHRHDDRDTQCATQHHPS